jgi:ribosomal protein S18 acetylase RimI-like enzyme
MTVTFRLAKAEQLNDIRSLFLSAMAPIANRMGIDQPADAYSDLSAFLETRNLYIAQEDGVLLASAAMHEVDNCLYLDTIAVLPQHQNKGLGSRLLAEVELIAESRELPCLRLHTPEVMHELLAYYTKRGFGETHRSLPAHERDLILRVTFEKAIAGNGFHMDPFDEHDRQFA